MTEAVIQDYEESCDLLGSTVAVQPDLLTKARYVHPWFGALNAYDWHALAAHHLALHRVQIERILEGLKAGG